MITDQVMPLMNGLDMISRLAMERYPARYLVISGYFASQPGHSALPFLSKPFTSSQVIDAVERLQQEPTLIGLERAWDLAKRAWKETVKETEEILSDVPSQIPHPDGALRIERAALKRTTTYERYVQAFHKYKDTLQACGVLGETTYRWRVLSGKKE